MSSSSSKAQVGRSLTLALASVRWSSMLTPSQKPNEHFSPTRRGSGLHRPLRRRSELAGRTKKIPARARDTSKF